MTLRRQVRAAISTDKGKQAFFYSYFSHPNYGHDEGVQNPASTNKNKALSSRNLVSLFSISLTMEAFYKIKSFLPNDLIAP